MDGASLGEDHRRRANLWLVGTAVCCLAAAAVLRWAPPGSVGFYPQCPFYQATGWLCPGCGATRALAALAAGHLADAWQMNALLLCLLPILFLYLGEAYRRARRGDAEPWPPVPPEVTYGLVAAALLFGVLRNLV